MKKFFTIFFVCVCLIVQVTSVTYSCDHSAACGCSRNDPILNKIVGGEAAVSSSWDWAVSLRDFTGEHICGGAIISPKYIVTAAHCVLTRFDFSLKVNMSVAVGMDRLNESETIGEVRKVIEIIAHPSYNQTTKANDIAVLRLDSSLDLSVSASTARICLPRLNIADSVETYPPNSSSLVAIGWGTLHYGDEDIPNQLQQVTVNALAPNDDTCYSSINHPELQFCAGVNGGGKDTCQGDSGGPLMRFESAQRRWVLAGLTSYGEDCGSPLYAGVYTRVATYIDWLRSIVDNDGLIMVDVDTSVVQSTSITTIAIDTSSIPETSVWATTPSQTSVWATTTSQTSVSTTTSRSIHNKPSVKIASYSFIFLFLVFHHIF